MPTLILARSEVQKLINFPECIALMDQVFRYEGLGQAFSLTQNFALASTAGIVSMKAGHLPEKKRVGLKSLGTVILCDQRQLREPLAIIEQSLITFLRTGAAGAVAARALARSDSKQAAILGTGKQGRAQLLALKEVLPLESVTAWSPTRENREAFSIEMSKELGIAVHAVGSVKEAVATADIIVTATRATAPILEADWVRPGTHINAMGADMPGAQELSADLFNRAKVFADVVAQALWMGACNVPITKQEFPVAGILGSLGEVLNGTKSGRESKKDITVFDCSGVGMMDVIVADYIYQKAHELKEFKSLERALLA